ncbi:SRPBCC family protein [Pseudocnuella soli]|uniref:SRPBCC family protein n=1 Tax=Pseudocnuella soli TaxID=2502779 RepID=UPI001052E7CB|nr:SRPBCC family protein [Pseudocnuella soli]
MYQVSIEKDFPVTAEELYQAWTEPEALKRWWHPMGNDLLEVENSLQPGGKVRYIFEAGQQKERIEISGNYETVEPAKQLVYTWNWHLPQATIGNGHYKLTIGFEANGTYSKLSVRQDNFDSEEAIQPHQQGWEAALNDLHQFVSQGKAAE